MGQFQSPVLGNMKDPYEGADRQRDLDATTPPSDGRKVREDAVLAQQKGPIAPLTRTDTQLQYESDVAGSRKALKSRRRMQARALGGKR